MSKRPDSTPHSGAQGIQNALRILEGRWKLVILFQLFGGKTLRFSELERTIPGSRTGCGGGISSCLGAGCRIWGAS